VQITVENLGSDDAAVTLEDLAWIDTAATAAVVGTVPAFRTLFSAEVLAPGLEVRIERLAFLFTDLAGSTALYERVGETRAYRLVQEHFRLLDRAVVACRGAVVKTIGDAVMAVFPTGQDALAAAVEIQHSILGLEGEGHVDPSRLVRVGVHEGPCVAVTLNGRLDYFGTTVNLAARIEHESDGGEIVASADLYEGARASPLAQSLPVRADPFLAQLRGISAPTRLYRITLTDGAARASQSNPVVAEARQR
jgi:adenylate cyclase